MTTTAEQLKKANDLIFELALALDQLMEVEGSEPPESDDEDTQAWFDQVWQEASDNLKAAAHHLKTKNTTFKHTGYVFKHKTVEEKLDEPADEETA